MDKSNQEHNNKLNTMSTSGFASTAPTLNRPASRKQGKKKEQLGASLTRFIKEASSDDLSKISSQLEKALSSTHLKSWKNVGGSITSPSLAKIHSKSMAYLEEGKGGSGTIRRDSSNAEWADLSAAPTGKKRTTNNLLIASAMGLSSSNTAQTSSDLSTNKEEDEYYGPTPTSRRGSCGGKELISSMKIKAQEVLAELGDIDIGDSDCSSRYGGLFLNDLQDDSMRVLPVSANDV